MNAGEIVVLIVLSYFVLSLIVACVWEARKHRKLKKECPETYRIMRALFPEEYGRR